MKLSGHYYRESAAAVLDAFASRTTGLTVSEAKDRKKHTQALPNEVFLQQHSQTVLLPALGLRLILLLLGAAAALYVGQIGLAILLFCLVLLLGLAVGFYERTVYRGHLAAHVRIPRTVVVVRENKLHTIGFNGLVAGDIIYLQHGDIVPADARIIKATGCVASETIFDVHATHVAKNSRTITTFVDQSKQASSLFFGSHIIAGEAYAVVTAVSADTQIAQLMQPLSKQKNYPFSTFVAKQQQRLDLGTLVLLALFAILAWTNELSLVVSIELASLLVVASSLLDWHVIALFLAARRAHLLGSFGVRTSQLSAFEAIGSSRTIIANLAGSFMAEKPELQSLHIGKRNYPMDGTPLLEKTAEPLQLVYTVGRLLSHTKHGKIFSPLTKHLPTLPFQSFHQVAPLPEIFSDLHGGVWESKQQTVLAATGNLAETMDYCSDIWDHGHVRPLSSKDKAELLDVVKDNPHSVGIAYAADPTATRLVFLAYGLVESAVNPKALQAFTSLKKAGLNIVFIGEGSLEKTNELLEKINLPKTEYTLANHADLAHVKPSAIAARLQQTTPVLYDVSSTDIQHIIKAANTLGPTTLSGNASTEATVLHSADVIIATSGSAASEQAVLTAPKLELDTLTAIVHESRAVVQQLSSSFFASLLALSCALLFVWVSLAGLFFWHVTPLVSVASLVFVLVLITVPIRVAIGWHVQSDKLMRLQPSRLISSQPTAHHAAIIAFTAAILSCASGLAYLSTNNVSPQYLGTSSQIYAKAMTITMLVFAICLLVHVVISWLHDAPIKQKNFLASKSGLLATALSGLLLYAFTYSPFVQDIFGSSTINSRDWLLVLGATALFTLVTTITYFDHKHTRKSIVKLHTTTTTRRPT